MIRTNSYDTKLTIDAFVDSADKTKGDTVKHFDKLGDLVITKVAMGSYDEYGRVGGTCLITEGHIVVTDKGEMTSIAVNNEDTSKVDIETEGNGAVGIVFVASETIANAMKKATNTGVNEWFFEYTDESGNPISMDDYATADEYIEAVINRINVIAEQSRCYIKENNQYYVDFESALAVLKNDNENLKTIVLVRDYDKEYVTTTALTIEKGVKVTLDLNGHIFRAIFCPTAKQHGVTTTQAILNEGDLTICDTTNSSGCFASIDELPDGADIPGAGEYVVHNKGTFTLQSGMLKSETAAGASYCVETVGSFVMNGGVLYHPRASTCRVRSGTAEFNGGKLLARYEGEGSSYAVYTQTCQGNTKVTINDGYFYGDVYIFDDNGATVNYIINGGTFENANYIAKRSAATKSSMVINGGTFSSYALINSNTVNGATVYCEPNNNYCYASGFLVDGKIYKYTIQEWKDKGYSVNPASSEYGYYRYATSGEYANGMGRLDGDIWVWGCPTSRYSNGVANMTATDIVGMYDITGVRTIANIIDTTKYTITNENNGWYTFTLKK